MSNFDLSAANDSASVLLPMPLLESNPLAHSNFAHSNFAHSGDRARQAMLSLPASPDPQYAADGLFSKGGISDLSANRPIATGASAFLQPLIDELSPVYPSVGRVLTEPAVARAIQTGATLLGNGSQAVEKALIVTTSSTKATAHEVGLSVRTLKNEVVTEALERWQTPANRAQRELTDQSAAFVSGLKELTAEVDSSQWMARLKKRLEAASGHVGTFVEKINQNLGYFDDGAPTREAAALAQAQQQLKENLVDLREGPDFIETFETAFGDRWAREAAEAIVDEVIEETAAPTVQVVDADWLQAEAAYGDNTIFVSDAFLAQSVSDPKALVDVLLEEIGHYFDQSLNTTDSAGDEGAIFARLAQGETFLEGELARLQQEDDSAVLRVNDASVNDASKSSRFITVEQSNSRSPYTIEPGDSLWRIAEREWQDGTRWRDIQKEDGSAFSATSLILPGD
ncbi:MAG: LysM domain-containing protein, partial [Cyanobacteria bacterium J06598_1]